MNAITKALSDLRFTIPYEIINIAFRETNQNVNSIVSLDEMIMHQVMRPRILVDCDLVGGIQISIDLRKCSITRYENEYIVTVPKTLTDNKSIISVQYILSSLYQGSTTVVPPYAGGNSIIESATAVLGSYGGNTAAPINTSRLEAIGDNVIIVRDPASLLTSGTLICNVGNDANLNNIKPKSFLKFAKLVQLGVKAYVYNKLVTKIDAGYIYNGHELGVVRDIISDYASANDEYSDYLSVWANVAYHNDNTKMTNLISSKL